MACKASLTYQQKQVQENIHAQIKSFSMCINEILLPYTKMIGEAQELPPQPINAPCQSGFGFAVGRNGQPTNFLAKKGIQPVYNLKHDIIWVETLETKLIIKKYKDVLQAGLMPFSLISLCDLNI
ncbi:hypothetical protein CMV_002362 [Castanea mollissima]|uniref:Uncharacterized protein n=1 Tax=Castanea mollissima TaxID=60419 RepID=A0A8J4RUR3_9ROSI|nr:hypothetical protein CMV_002362 [Castanea mollissima]